MHWIKRDLSIRMQTTGTSLQMQGETTQCTLPALHQNSNLRTGGQCSIACRQIKTPRMRTWGNTSIFDCGRPPQTSRFRVAESGQGNTFQRDAKPVEILGERSWKFPISSLFEIFLIRYRRRYCVWACEYWHQFCVCSQPTSRFLCCCHFAAFVLTELLVS